MSSPLSHTTKKSRNGVNSGEQLAEQVFGTAENAIGSSKGSTMRTFIRALPMIVKGVSTVAGVFSLVRSLNRDEGFAWFGLAPRRRPFRALASFGVGALVGVGVGMLFAPMSGADIRRAIFKGDKDQ